MQVEPAQNSADTAPLAKHTGADDQIAFSWCATTIGCADNSLASLAQRLLN
jgi:hypothetical protein